MTKCAKRQLSAPKDSRVHQKSFQVRQNYPWGVKIGHSDSELDQIWNVGLENKVEVNDEVKMEVNLVKHDWMRLTSRLGQ